MLFQKLEQSCHPETIVTNQEVQQLLNTLTMCKASVTYTIGSTRAGVHQVNVTQPEVGNDQVDIPIVSQKKLALFRSPCVSEQDEVPGLQVFLDGEWIDVPPRPGAFICNIGDMLQRW